MSVLEMREITKVYGSPPNEVHALTGVDLSVDAGHLVAVMGPSGSGKSTLLTIAGSLEEPTSGEVVVNGQALGALSRNQRAALRRRTIGYVNVLRDAMAVDALEECGVYFGTTGGQVFASPDGGDTWGAIASNLPRVLSVEVQTLA